MALAMATTFFPTSHAVSPAPASSRASFGSVRMLQSKAPSRGRISVRASSVDASKVSPQADRVLIRLEELSDKSEGGVLLPKSAVKFERYLIGEVISVGNEAESVEKGQKVIFSDINAYEVNFGTPGKHCFCRAGDLLATIK